MEFVRENESMSDDSGLFVEFYTKAMPDVVASKAAGHEVCKDVDYIRIQLDAYNTYDQPVVDTEEYSDVRRFPKQWEIYCNRKDETFLGVPIEKLFPGEPSKAANYRHRKVVTVEQLASTSDGNLMGMGMGSMQDRQKALKYLERAKEDFATDQATKLQAYNSALEDKIKELSAQIEVLAQAGSKAAKKAKVVVSEPDIEGLEAL